MTSWRAFLLDLPVQAKEPSIKIQHQATFQLIGNVMAQDIASIVSAVANVILALTAIVGAVKILQEIHKIRRDEIQERRELRDRERKDKFEIYSQSDAQFVEIHKMMAQDNELFGSIHHRIEISQLSETVILKNFVFFHIITSMLERAYFKNAISTNELSENKQGWDKFTRLQFENPLFLHWWKLDDYGYYEEFTSFMNDLAAEEHRNQSRNQSPERGYGE
jgi:hypothetical protein